MRKTTDRIFFYYFFPGMSNHKSFLTKHLKKCHVIVILPFVVSYFCLFIFCIPAKIVEDKIYYVFCVL